MSYHTEAARSPPLAERVKTGPAPASHGRVGPSPMAGIVGTRTRNGSPW